MLQVHKTTLKTTSKIYKFPHDVRIVDHMVILLHFVGMVSSSHVDPKLWTIIWCGANQCGAISWRVVFLSCELEIYTVYPHYNFALHEFKKSVKFTHPVWSKWKFWCFIYSSRGIFYCFSFQFVLYKIVDDSLTGRAQEIHQICSSNAENLCLITKVDHVRTLGLRICKLEWVCWLYTAIFH